MELTASQTGILDVTHKNCDFTHVLHLSFTMSLVYPCCYHCSIETYQFYRLYVMMMAMAVMTPVSLDDIDLATTLTDGWAEHSVTHITLVFSYTASWSVSPTSLLVGMHYYHCSDETSQFYSLYVMMRAMAVMTPASLDDMDPAAALTDRWAEHSVTPITLAISHTYLPRSVMTTSLMVCMYGWSDPLPVLRRKRSRPSIGSWYQLMYWMMHRGFTWKRKRYVDLCKHFFTVQPLYLAELRGGWTSRKTPIEKDN